jgi:hypothetical protein
MAADQRTAGGRGTVGQIIAQHRGTRPPRCKGFVATIVAMNPNGTTRRRGRSCQRGRSPPQRAHNRQEYRIMLATIAIILFVLWLLGVVAFHVTAFAIHVLLIIAVIMLVLHFVRGRAA